MPAQTLWSLFKCAPQSSGSNPGLFPPQEQQQEQQLPADNDANSDTALGHKDQTLDNTPDAASLKKQLALLKAMQEENTKWVIWHAASGFEMGSIKCHT
jgi:hypothetical protein